MSNSDLYGAVEATRAFNRFYTLQIGALRRDFLDTSFSLTEARVLYELAHGKGLTAGKLARELGLDAGYLSRMLHSFRKQGLIEGKASDADRREELLSITKMGAASLAQLDRRSREKNGQMLKDLPATDRVRLVGAMHTIQELLGPRPDSTQPYVLRTPRAGDMGWIVHRHGALYFHEYGWDEKFEALVAGIVAKFVQQFDPARERCWIAERNEEILGCVFLVKHSKTVAQLRLLLVEPKARGLGIGTTLVDECVRFARSVGYKKIILWTNNVLHAARHIYEKKGFQLIREEPHHSFGRDLKGQTWQLKL